MCENLIINFAFLFALPVDMCRHESGLIILILLFLRKHVLIFLFM